MRDWRRCPRLEGDDKFRCLQSSGVCKTSAEPAQLSNIRKVRGSRIPDSMPFTTVMDTWLAGIIDALH